MITKIAQFGRIQILDEREPDAGKYGFTIQACANVDLTEGGVKVGKLDEHRCRITPESDLPTVFGDLDALLQESGVSETPLNLKERASAVHAAVSTPLVVARYRLTRAKTLKEPQAIQVAQDAVDSLTTPEPASLHKETRLSLMTILPDGSIQIRLRLCICENGEICSKPKYWGVVLHPNSNLDIQSVFENINASMVGDNDGWGPATALPQGDIDRMKEIAVLEHTPAVIAAWEARQAELQELG